jgi:hypothetical protein
MSNFHTLNLRESINRREKTQNNQAVAKKKHKDNVKEILTNNIIRKFQNRISMGTASSSLYLSRIVSREVDNFLGS